jgi:hypothetical protein
MLITMYIKKVLAAGFEGRVMLWQVLVTSSWWWRCIMYRPMHGDALVTGQQCNAKP